MYESQSPFLKFFEIKRAFFQALHACNTAEQAHPGQVPILCLLLRTGESSQADIVRKMKVSAATVAVSVARLERLGLITRERNQTNQRANVLHLTEKGQKVAAEMNRTVAKLEETALLGFSAEEKLFIENCCDRMIQNLQDHCIEKE